MKKHNILIGSDPEVFMYRLGKAKSAHGVIPGTKDNPYPVKDGAVQVDGMALEFNINPAATKKEFVSNLKSVMGTLNTMIPKGHELKATPTAHFSAYYMRKQPAEAKELGCDPDFNAYKDGEANPRPNGKVNFRTGAGHVHIGWTNNQDINHPDHIEACCILTRELDYYLGLGSMLFDPDTQRRELYGKAGAFRPKPYGCEYRVLSNAWLNDERLMGWVYNRVHQAWDNLMKGKRAYVDYGSIAASCLAGNHRENYVRYYMERLNIPMPPVIK